MKQELEFKIEGKEWVSLQDAAFNKLNKTCFSLGTSFFLMTFSNPSTLWLVNSQTFLTASKKPIFSYSWTKVNTLPLALQEKHL